MQQAQPGVQAPQPGDGRPPISGQRAVAKDIAALKELSPALFLDAVTDVRPLAAQDPKHSFRVVKVVLRTCGRVQETPGPASAAQRAAAAAHASCIWCSFCSDNQEFFGSDTSSSLRQHAWTSLSRARAVSISSAAALCTMCYKPSRCAF